MESSEGTAGMRDDLSVFLAVCVASTPFAAYSFSLRVHNIKMQQSINATPGRRNTDGQPND